MDKNTKARIINCFILIPLGRLNKVINIISKAISDKGKETFNPLAATSVFDIKTSDCWRRFGEEEKKLPNFTFKGRNTRENTIQ